jgi:Ala-tRNA(Pro) deacylase
MSLETFLHERGIPCERHEHRISYTAQRLAEVEHVPGHMVAKPVIVKGQSGYAMCVLPATRHVDLARVAEVLDESEVELATEPEMAGLFPECEVGAEPPIGAIFGLRTIVDPSLMRDDELIMQAGSHTESVKMRRADWERVCRPIIAPIAQG